jgi:hypothetical protein
MRNQKFIPALISVLLFFEHTIGFPCRGMMVAGVKWRRFAGGQRPQKRVSRRKRGECWEDEDE